MRIIQIVCVLLLSAVFTTAAPIVSNVWETPGSEDGWTIVDISGGAAYGAIEQADDGDGFLGITGGDAQLGFPTDRIRDTTGGTYTDLTVAERILFDFYAADAAPDKLYIYFIDTVSGDEWRHVVNVGAGWNYGEGVSVEYGSGWWNVAGPQTGAAFSNAIDDISEIGILLTYRENIGGQVYGLDNFWLDDEQWPMAVPEPGVATMLTSVFISLGITFRRKLNDSLSNLKKSLQS
ncbi:MAG: hypothetical protein JXN60_08205 [Lentisphaerae bacterium]|nr:hypothetical protein [Lentisphaerota bacterium]